MAGRAADKADATMSEIQQRRCHRPGRLHLVDRHARAACGLDARRQPRIGRAGALQRVQRRQVVAHRRRQQKAVRPQRRQRRRHRRVGHFVALVVGLNDQVIPRRPAALDRSLLHLGEIVRDQLRRRHADQERTRARQAAGENVAPIAQRLDRRLDLLAGLGADVTLAVQHARHRHHRQPCARRHVLDRRRHAGSPFIRADITWILAGGRFLRPRAVIA